jgi:hypothetical protein
MVELVHRYQTPLRTGSGETYLASAFTDQQPRGLWEAWFVFFPLAGGRPLATDLETTQSKREDVVYWATGISPAYLEGALTRALARLPEVRLTRHIARAEAEEAYARAEARAYEAARDQALAAAREAEAQRREAEDRLRTAGGPGGRPRRKREGT